jgi:hypothetical protein
MVKKFLFPRIIFFAALYTLLITGLTAIQFSSKSLAASGPATALAEAPPAATTDKPDEPDEPPPPANFEEAAAETKAEASFDNISLRAFYEPQYFSPDGDGRNDRLYITLGVDGATDIASWDFTIFQPEISGAARKAFKRFTGVALPTGRIVWNGVGDDGKLVLTATDYPYSFTVTDSNGTVSKPLDGVIHVDILVHRQPHGLLQIQVPSIVFRSYAADFSHLPQQTVDANRRAIHRLAAILNKFPDYNVRVEGHANAETPPNTPNRSAEERIENRAGSLSERRAQAIVRMLVADGVAARRLTAVGMGISEPIIPYGDKENWWQNRRVEFYLVRDKSTESANSVEGAKAE